MTKLRPREDLEKTKVITKRRRREDQNNVMRRPRENLEEFNRRLLKRMTGENQEKSERKL